MNNEYINNLTAEKAAISNNTQIVLFSGGRDSTLTASLLMMRNIPVYLLC